MDDDKQYEADRYGLLRGMCYGLFLATIIWGLIIASWLLF